MLISESIQQFIRWQKFNLATSSVKCYELTLRQFAVFMRNCDIEDVTMEHTLEWLELMQEMNWDRNSLIPKATALRKLFDFHRRNGLHVLDPYMIPVPAKIHKKPRVATEEEYTQLMSIIPFNNDPRHVRNRAIISLLWDTGARNGEICSLDVDDIDLTNNQAIIRTEKNRGSRPFREIFWTEQTSLFVSKWMEKRENLQSRITHMDPNALFIGICSGGAGGNGQRLKNKSVGEMLRRYSHRAGTPVVNAHSFRHRMGHHIIQNGGTNSDVSNILGHTSLQSSYIYTQMHNKELRERYDRFMNLTV